MTLKNDDGIADKAGVTPFIGVTRYVGVVMDFIINAIVTLGNYFTNDLQTDRYYSNDAQTDRYYSQDP
jgi:hypothetical protein